VAPWHDGTVTVTPERVYESNDRFAEIVLRSLCSQLGIETRRDDRGPGIVARASSDAVLDTLERMMGELMPQLDRELVKTTKKFVLKTMGKHIEIRLAKPAP